MDLDAAIGIHAQWKAKLREAIENSETLDADSIAADDHCELGKWLRADARRLMGAAPALDDCIAKHAAFHRQAAKVAAAINAKQLAEATAMISPGTPYANASLAVGASIIRLMTEFPS